jgi:LysM repeat protein
MPHDQPAGKRASKAGRWWGSLVGVGIAATRTHSVDASRPRQAAAEDDELDDWPDSSVDTVDHEFDDQWDERWEAASSPAPAPRSGVDPLLARFGGIAVIVTLLVPVFLGFASDSDSDATVRTQSAPLQIPAPGASTGDVPAADSAPALPAPTPAAPTPASLVPASTSAAATTAVAPTSSVTTTSEPTAVPTSDVAAQALAAPECPVDYEVVAGDFWIRLADESGTPLADLLDVNDATLDTALFPGGSICLPEGADIPAPPTTASPATTNAPVSTNSRPAAAPPTTSPPVTTKKPAPTKTAAPPPAAPRPPATTASPSEVQAIIRAVWPDELENRAIEIAQRESRFIPTARNFCCYGVFQMYWSVHKGWLAGLGITSAEQLYDPTLNARAALALYERSGGWGPWGG